MALLLISPFNMGRLGVKNAGLEEKLTLFLAVIKIVAADETKKECPELTSKENFEPDKYFTGSWHVTHIMINGQKLEAKDLCCMEFKSEKLPNNTIKEILVHYYPNKAEEPKFVYIENHISEESLKEIKGRYIAQYRAVDKEGKMNHKDFSPITYTIRDTDYSSYSILNMCEIWDNGNKLCMYSFLEDLDLTLHYK
uniref:Nitrophorin domain-containing protein n=1 Tax=Rhodnius prolixus TaxID=13249 RepID=T1H8V9_RHOPR